MAKLPAICKITLLSLLFSLPESGCPHSALQTLLLLLQGLLHGCAQAINQIRQPARPSLLSACSLATCQPPHTELDSRLWTNSTVKSELEGSSPACQSLSVKSEGNHPVCPPLEAEPKGNHTSCLSAEAQLEGNLVICLSAKAELKGSQQAQEECNTPAVGVLQDVPEVPDLPQLPQGIQTALHKGPQSRCPTHGMVVGDSTQVRAEGGLECHQAEVEPMPRLCQAGLHHGSAAVKLRCMPNWGKPKQAQTALPSNPGSAGCQSNQTGIAALAPVPPVLTAAANLSHSVQEAPGSPQQDTLEQDLACVYAAGQQQPGSSLMPWHNHELSTGAVRPLQLPTKGCDPSSQIQRQGAAILDCQSAHGSGLLSIAKQICRSKDMVPPSALL